MESELLLEGSDLPLRITPSSAPESRLEALREWMGAERAFVDEALLRHGGLLFRGFSLESAADFELFCQTVDPSLLAYVGGESPRKAVTQNVYTSTEYPAHLEISLHNEMSYAAEWPRRLYFFCLTPPGSGGETNLAEGRRILAALDPAVHRRFAERGVMYVRNLQDGRGLGKSWQDTFETSDRSRVEEECRRSGVEFQWTEFGLRTTAVRPGTIRHPQTGDEVWFNQADLFHVSSRGPRVERSLRKTLGEDELPRHAYFGDRSPIGDDDLAAVRAAYRAAEVAFPWQAGDVLILDNVLVTHGRRPFEGERRILVAMA